MARALIRGHGVQPVPWVEFVNGSRCECRSFDRPDLLRGSASDLCMLDESCYLDEDSVNAVVRPMLSDRRGDLILCSTPRGYDWVWKLFERGQRHENSTESWKFPTSSGPRFQSSEGQHELELIRSTTPKLIYQQEYECSPLANIARVFAEEDLRACTIPDAPPISPIAGRYHVLGIDVGRVKDHGAFCVMDNTGLVVCSEQIPLGIAYEQQARRAGELQRKWNSSALIDSTGGGMGGHNTLGQDAVVTVYRQHVQNLREITFSLSSKELMVSGLSVLLEQRKIKIPAAHGSLLAELASYEYSMRPGGRYRYAASTGHHDDLVCALMLAALAVRNNWLPSGKLGPPPAF